MTPSNSSISHSFLLDLDSSTSRAFSLSPLAPIPLNSREIEFCESPLEISINQIFKQIPTVEVDFNEKFWSLGESIEDSKIEQKKSYGLNERKNEINLIEEIREKIPIDREESEKFIERIFSGEDENFSLASESKQNSLISLAISLCDSSTLDSLAARLNRAENSNQKKIKRILEEFRTNVK